MNATGGCAYLFAKVVEAAIIGGLAWSWAKHHDPAGFGMMVGLGLLAITTTIAGGAMKK